METSLEDRKEIEANTDASASSEARVTPAQILASFHTLARQIAIFIGTASRNILSRILHTGHRGAILVASWECSRSVPRLFQRSMVRSKNEPAVINQKRALAQFRTAISFQNLAR